MKLSISSCQHLKLHTCEFWAKVEVRVTVDGQKCFLLVQLQAAVVSVGVRSESPAAWQTRSQVWRPMKSASWPYSAPHAHPRWFWHGVSSWMPLLCCLAGRTHCGLKERWLCLCVFHWHWYDRQPVFRAVNVRWEGKSERFESLKTSRIYKQYKALWHQGKTPNGMI